MTVTTAQRMAGVEVAGARSNTCLAALDDVCVCVPIVAAPTLPSPPNCRNHEVEQLVAMDNTTMRAAAARYPYPQARGLPASKQLTVLNPKQHTIFKLQGGWVHCSSEIVHAAPTSMPLPSLRCASAILALLSAPPQDPSKIETGANVGIFYLEQFGTNFVNTSGRGCAAR